MAHHPPSRRAGRGGGVSLSGHARGGQQRARSLEALLAKVTVHVTAPIRRRSWSPDTFRTALPAEGVASCTSSVVRKLRALRGDGAQVEAPLTLSPDARAR